MLTIKNTASSRKRKLIGSSDITIKSHDTCSDVRISVLSLNPDLTMNKRLYFVYEQLLSAAIGSFLFFKPNEDEAKYQKKFIERILETKINLTSRQSFKTLNQMLKYYPIELEHYSQSF